MLETYHDEYYYLSHAKRRNIDRKYKPKELFIKRYDYRVWLINLEETIDLSDMPPLAGDEELKKGKGINMLTQSKLLIRLSILLEQIKAGNNS